MFPGRTQMGNLHIPETLTPCFNHALDCILPWDGYVPISITQRVSPLVQSQAMAKYKRYPPQAYSKTGQEWRSYGGMVFFLIVESITGNFE